MRTPFTLTVNFAKKTCYILYCHVIHDKQQTYICKQMIFNLKITGLYIKTRVRYVILVLNIKYEFYESWTNFAINELFIQNRSKHLSTRKGT